MLIWKTALPLNWRTSLVSPASAPVAAANVERLVLTGATGFLGSTVLTALINAGLLERVVCIVRAQDRGHAVARLRDAALCSGLAPYWAARIGDANVVVGALDDVWDRADAGRLTAATHVIHCAGHASVADGAHLQTDLDSTLRFAARCTQAPHLRRFVYVGTAFAGTAGAGVVQEEPERAPCTGETPRGAVLTARYLHAKAETERRLRALGLPLVVVRPSHVVGHTVLGTRPAPNSFWMFRVAHAARRFTARPMTRIDIVSVDDVARATMLLAVKPTLAHRVYHVSAGEDAPMVAQIVRAMDEAVGIADAPRYAACAPADLPQVVRTVLGRADPARERVIGDAMRRFAEFATVDRVFDNRRLRDEIDFEPLPFVDYVEACMRTSRGIPVTDLMRGARD
ncbi:SDR family oxidoreductase [Burkholderia multivorans]|nr:SDR family oxidoreductase [Burkholderia multivorans]MDN7873306.1 SDR family oxidoreductase [Burkholderia multivorans]